MSCGQGDATHASCEVKSFWGVASSLRWQVYLDDRLVADGLGLQFDPVIDEEWRTVQVYYPIKEGKAVFRVEARWNADAKKAEFRADSRSAFFVPYETKPVAERLAVNHPP